MSINKEAIKFKKPYAHIMEYFATGKKGGRIELLI